MKFAIIFLLVLVSFFTPLSTALAITNPLDVPNNKYGIHVVNERDLANAASLVNSAGGDWGYVTMVIQDSDRDIGKWQNNLDLARSFHLIPIIRLATHPAGDIWETPKVSDAKDWADFLSSLYWVSKNRYIVIFNEPNHASEWGGYINPQEYAQILSVFSNTLKQSSNDFFILPAGLDASAPNSRETMDEVDFVKGMIAAEPELFSRIDGWTSHSYPNPGFRGLTTDEGRGSLRTYRWEQEILQSFGVNFRFPLFITETGWPHKDGLAQNLSYYSPELISELISEAARDVWSDPQIAAVTPFILNYQSIPFSAFSWTKPGETGFYPYFDTYKALTKTAGRPLLNSAFGNFSGPRIANLVNDYTRGLTQLRSRFTANPWWSLFLRLFKL